MWRKSADEHAWACVGVYPCARKRSFIFKQLGNTCGGDAQHPDLYFPPTHWLPLSPPVLESYLPSTPFEKRKTFLCAICISICWHWRHGKWIIGLMGNVGERGIEKDREKAAWKKNSHYWTFFFLLPTTTTLHFTIHLSTTCVAEKIYLGLPFSLFLHNSLPQSFSRVHTNALTLSHPYSSSVSLAPSVTHSMALIHQLALRADNGLFHIAKEKEKQIERERARVSE